MKATMQASGDRYTLRFERRLAHSPARVWQALTERDQLKQWFPADLQGERTVGATIRFVFANNEAPTRDGTITDFDEPWVFAYTWGGELLRWELRPDGAGCLLIFTHTFDDRPGSASFATGWEGCLAGLASVLAGEPVEALPDHAERHDAYVEAFGLAEGSVQRTSEGWLVRFERLFAHPLAKVWAALNETESLAPAGGVALVGGSPPLRFTNAYVAAGAVSAFEPPRLLEYQWLADEKPVGLVRWELTDWYGWSRLLLTQSGPPGLADQRSTALAAWHTHLELLADHLRGQTRCWPPERTSELVKHYAGALI